MRSKPSITITETKLFAELLQISKETEMLRSAGLGTYFLDVQPSLRCGCMALAGSLAVIQSCALASSTVSKEN